MNMLIQPKYEKVVVTCSCGNKFSTRSTKCEDFVIDVCSSCHPFYTGEQRIVDTEGLIDNFKRKYGNLMSRKI